MTPVRLPTTRDAKTERVLPSFPDRPNQVDDRCIEAIRHFELSDEPDYLVLVRELRKIILGPRANDGSR